MRHGCEAAALHAAVPRSIPEPAVAAKHLRGALSRDQLQLQELRLLRRRRLRRGPEAVRRVRLLPLAAAVAAAATELNTRYLWDHSNGTQLREFLVDEYVGGAAGLASPDIDGVFLDDGWGAGESWCCWCWCCVCGCGCYSCSC